MADLLCPVRGCGAPLAPERRAYTCPRGHSFDLARSGYCNLLQPQDRRSKEPGDSRQAVLARRRFLEAGHGDLLLEALRETLGTLPRPPAARRDLDVLDIGCGEGFYLGTLAGERRMAAHGIDISASAVDLAARRYPAVHWFVVSADHSLPYSDASLELALSLALGRRRLLAGREVLLPRLRQHGRQHARIVRRATRHEGLEDRECRGQRDVLRHQMADQRLDWSCPGFVDTIALVSGEGVHDGSTYPSSVSAGVSAADGGTRPSRT